MDFLTGRRKKSRPGPFSMAQAEDAISVLLTKSIT